MDWIWAPLCPLGSWDSLATVQSDQFRTQSKCHTFPFPKMQLTGPLSMIDPVPADLGPPGPFSFRPGQGLWTHPAPP